MIERDGSGFDGFSQQQMDLLLTLTNHATKDASNFSRDQERDLASLGLDGSAIDELRFVLGSCASLGTKKQPSRQDVHDKIAEALRSVTASIAMVTPLNHFVDMVRTSAQTEAMSRLVVADFKLGGKGDVINGAIHQLHLLKSVLAGAIEDLPAAKRQQGVHQWVAVGMIHLALVRSLAGCDDPSADIGDLGPSSGINSRFRRVVGICFDAANNATGSDPEWAIKRYLKHLKLHR